MKLSLGDKVICASDLSVPEITIRGTVTKIWTDRGTELVQLNNNKESVFYSAFLWPERAEAELLKILQERAKLKKAFDDSMSLIYQLGNEITRGEK